MCNWLTNLVCNNKKNLLLHKLSQLHFPLSIRGLVKLFHSVSSEELGQQYLFEGPEVADLQRMRSMENVKPLVTQMISYFCDIFQTFADDLKDECVDREPDANEIEYEIDMYMESRMTDYDFTHESDDDFWSFLAYLDEEQQDGTNNQTEAFRTSITNDAASSASDPQSFNELMDKIKSWYQANQAAGHSVDESLLQDLTAKFTAVQEARAEAVRLGDLPENNQWVGSAIEEYMSALANVTAEVMIGTIEYNISDSYSYGRSYNANELPEDIVPPWISEDDLQEAMTENFDSELFEWYKQNNSSGYGGLVYVAAESIGQRDYEYYEEQKRTMEHEHGEGILDTLILDWGVSAEDMLSGDPDFAEWEDTRLDYDVNEILSISNSLEESHMISGATVVAPYTHMMAAAILATAESDENLQFIFSGEINQTNIDPRTMVRGIEQSVRNNVTVPAILHTPEMQSLVDFWEEQQRREQEEREQRNVADNEERARRQEIENQRREEALNTLLEQQRSKEQYHEMLGTGYGRLSPEELQRLKELGISQRPFPHDYMVERRTYPGAGFSKMQGQPFRISISPQKDSVSPEFSKILQEMSIHNVGQAGSMPALGWAGGYADYDNKIMYVMEIQSDVMQTTSRMRDPRKIKEQANKEVIRLEKEIAKTQQVLTQTISPKQRLIQNLDRIRQENEALDINSPKYQQNQQTMDRLLSQLPSVPDVVDTSKTEAKLQQLQNQLAQSREGAEKLVYTPTGHTSYPQFHDYKSKMENMFKNWIPIFFNVVLREAKKRGFEKLMLIDADSLMKLWSKYARAETRQLFERVYDNTASFYGATPAQARNHSWWEIDILREERFAMSWFKRAIQKFGSHEWLMPLIPGGDRYVWQIHLDKFFEVMERKNRSEFGQNEFDLGNEYAQNEDKRLFFEEWLQEVPPELKIGNDLEPEFKMAVQQYVIQTQGFDPFDQAYTEEADSAPSSDELEDWWS